jgi:hypothetical protein
MSSRRKRDVPAGHALYRYLFGLTRASLDHLDLKDDEIALYLADMLVRFVRTDHLYQLKNAAGETLVHLVDMPLEVNESSGHNNREVRRHIGDYSLFLLGIFGLPQVS